MVVCEELSILDLLKVQTPRCVDYLPHCAPAKSASDADPILNDILTFVRTLISAEAEDECTSPSHPDTTGAPQVFFGISVGKEAESGVEHLTCFIQSQVNPRPHSPGPHNPPCTSKNHSLSSAITKPSHTSSTSIQHSSDSSQLSLVNSSHQQSVPATTDLDQPILRTPINRKAHHSPITPKSHSDEQIPPVAPLPQNLELELHPSPSHFFRETQKEKLSTTGTSQKSSGEVPRVEVDSDSSRNKEKNNASPSKGNSNTNQGSSKVSVSVDTDSIKGQVKDGISSSKGQEGKPGQSSSRGQEVRGSTTRSSKALEVKAGENSSKGQTKDCPTSRKAQEIKSGSSSKKDPHTKAPPNTHKHQQVTESSDSSKGEEKKSYKLPFISTDEQENKDNEDPRWKEHARLSTNEERYKLARKLWKNPCVPDPNRNLTVFGIIQLKTVNSQSSSGGRKRRRKQSYDMEDLQPARKRQRRFENVVFSTNHITKSKCLVTYEFLQNLEQPNISRQAAKKLENAHKEKQYMLDLALDEVRAIQHFYDGLPNQDLTMTQEEVERGWEATEHVYEIFGPIYGYSGQEFFP